MAKPHDQKLIKMGELVKRTGVQKETIRFYINKGLLPKPLKTGRNMAYYDEGYVERIRLIKELQLKHFLPLKVIKEIITSDSGKLDVREIDLIRKQAPNLKKLEELRQEFKPQTLAELSKRIGLPAEEILEMEKCEMIDSERDAAGERIYSDNDIRIVEAFAAMRKGGLAKEVGFTVDDFRLQSDLISMLAIEEVKVFARRFANRYPKDTPELLPKIAENAMDSVNAFVSHLRRKKILEAISKFSESGEEGLSETEE